MSEPFIKIEKLSYLYEDSAADSSPALKELSLQINSGEFVAILGHNGSGKSTLAKLLSMILFSTSGKITIDGMDITSDDLTDEDVMKLRKSVGMVFQNPDNQLVATIVEDDVAFGLENLGVPSAEIRERVDKALSDLGMLEYAKHEPHRLSGGQKQRIAIAGIIAMKPECMIFDESTAMLDPLGRKEVVETMEKLNREDGKTVITITHYMDEAVRADRVIVIDDGRVVLDGKPGEIFAKDKILRECGLDLPLCADLLLRLRKRGFELSGEINTPEQCAETIAAAIRK